MIIRQIRQEEISAIYDFIKFSFATSYISSGTEQDYASSLRNSDKYVKELELVIEDQGNILGHIMLTKFKVKGVNALMLGPICTHINYRNKGLGRTLVDVALENAKKLGYEVVFLVGDPKFFSQLGFKQTIEFGLKNSNNCPDETVLCKELKEGALKNAKGDFSIE